MNSTLFDSTLNSLKDTLTRRAKKCVNLAFPYLSTGEYFIAGSCIASSTVNDIDVFPAGEASFVVAAGEVLASTPSAKTIKAIIAGNPPIQFCHFKRTTLNDLISSFDFSHVQAGAHIKDGNVDSVAFTEAYLSYRLSSIVTFSGTEFPLSSLFRLMKYYKRNEIGRESSGLIISIIAAIIKRGFTDYEDFKRQLDAVDLGLIPEEIDNLSRSDLRDFYESLKK